MAEKVAELIAQSQDKKGIEKRALGIIIQLYADKSHFVYELLQNAEDAGATRIRFEQYADRLVVLHDGHPFTMENLKGLCDIGLSDKINDLNKIGEFGVGFKSVFSICDTVELYSHPNGRYENAGYKRYAIKIDDFIIPTDIPDQSLDPRYTTKFVFPYKVGLTFSGFDTLEELKWNLSEKLQNLGVTTLLFLKNLQSIDYLIDLPNLKKIGSYLLKKETINDHCSLVSEIDDKGSKNDKLSNSYLVFSRNIPRIQIGKTVDIAFAVTIEENGAYQFHLPKSPYISVYFPTGEESKLNFIVQGPYRTTPDRSQVPNDNKHNRYLAEQTAILLRDSAIELRDTGKLNFSFINILPVDESVFESAPLFKPLFSVTEDMFRRERLLPCIDGTYASADSVKIARGTGLTDVFTGNLLTELFKDGKKYHWLPTFLNERSTIYPFLTDNLKIAVIRPVNLRNLINNNRDFLPKRDNKWLIRLYQMFTLVPSEFNKKDAGSNLLTAEFVKTSDGSFVAPYRKGDGNDNNQTYLPNVFLPVKNTEGMDDVYFVDDTILKECGEFFNYTLRLTTPNEYDYFVKNFKTRYESGETISDEQHIADLNKLLLYQKNIDYYDEITNLIKNYLALRCIKDGKTVYAYPKKEKVLFPLSSDGLNIEQYYSNIISYPYVDYDFYKKYDISAEKLMCLGVIDDIAINKDVTKGKYSTGKRGTPDWNTYQQDFRWELSLDKLDEVLVYISNNPQSADSMAKSNFIFRYLQNHEKMLYGTLYVGGTVGCLDEVSTIVKILCQDPEYALKNWNGKWLFTKIGELVPQRDISRSDLNSHIYGDVKPESKLYDILGFLKSKKDLHDDVVNKYDQLDHETKEIFLEIALQRKYGLSSKELDEKYGSRVASDTALHTDIYSDISEFPSANVKNWELLRKHVIHEFICADDTKYEQRFRRIRVSKDPRSIDAYLRSMYKIDGADMYACQMCHEHVNSFEKCQLTYGMEKELDALYLCMCPNCARKYIALRNDTFSLNKFVDTIKNLKESAINYQDPVKISLGKESIWFTQRHIAEIKELMALKDDENKHLKTAQLLELSNNKDKQFTKNDEKTVVPQKPVNKVEYSTINNQPLKKTERTVVPQKPVNKVEFSSAKTNPPKKTERTVVPQKPLSKTKFSKVKVNLLDMANTAPKVKKLREGLDDYSKFIGKRIKHKSEGYGIIKECDGKRMGIEFESGKYANRVMVYSLSFLLSTNMIELVE